MRAVTGLKAVPHLSGRRIDLSWRNPPASDFAGGPAFSGVQVVRRERMFPRDETDGTVVHRHQDGIVTGLVDSGLEPNTSYYYRVYTADASPTPSFAAAESSSVAAFSTEDYGIAERLYRLLPAIHQRLDQPLGPAELAILEADTVAALAALPRDLRERGQLWRFLHAAAPFDLLRSFAEGLSQLHDTDVARPEFLPLLADWLGWELDRTLPVYRQRNEIKHAPHLYRRVGSLPSIQDLVSKYTGWHVQFAELAQHLVRCNRPPRLNVFSLVEDTSGWRAGDDAATVLGFGPGNDETGGTVGLPAVLAGTGAEPFSLQPNDKLTVTTDRRVPVTVLFRPGDFDDMTAIGAAELATVLDRHLSQLTARPVTGGRIELRSHILGPESSIRVERRAAALVSLEGAPRGRLSAFAEISPGADPRPRMFFASSDPEAPLLLRNAAAALAGKTPARALFPGESAGGATAGGGIVPVTGILPLPRSLVRYQTFRGETWGPSLPLLDEESERVGEPAAAQLQDGRVFVVWVERPDTGSARLRFRIGTVRSPQPAVLRGQRPQPFSLAAGMRLFIRGNWPEPEVFEVARLDAANPAAATAAELAAAMNARLSRVTATVQPDQTIALETVVTGGDERLEIDLQASTAAQALGFDGANGRATGDWGDTIDWSPAADVTPAAPGRHSDLFLLVDGGGLVWLFWSTHVGHTWRLVATRWNPTTQAWSSPLDNLADGIGGHREPCAVLDATDRIWLFWARRQGVGTPEDIWTIRRRVFTPLPGLWGPEAPVTSVPPGTRFADREPAAIRLTSGDLCLFLSSDRGGGADLWALTLDPATATVTGPDPVTSGHFAHRWPAPVRLPDGELILLHRSDRSVARSGLGTRPLPERALRVTDPEAVLEPAPAPPTSARSIGTDSLERFAGSITVVPGDSARNARRRLRDDLLSYTPQRPIGPPLEPPLSGSDLYTRGTIGLYLNRVGPDSFLTQQRVERLRSVLDRFLPINVRAVVVLAPRVDIELVYAPESDIGESYLDDHPFIEAYGEIAEETAAALPDWEVLLTNLLPNVTADPADPTTLRRRTFSPPPT